MDNIERIPKRDATLAARIEGITVYGEQISFDEEGVVRINFDGIPDGFPMHIDDFKKLLVKSLTRDQKIYIQSHIQQSMRNRGKPLAAKGLIEISVERGFQYGVLKINMLRRVLNCDGIPHMLKRMVELDKRKRHPEVVEYFMQHPEHFEILTEQLQRGDIRKPFKRRRRKKQ